MINLKLVLKNSFETFTSGLKDIIVKKEIDDKTLDQIEEYLIQSDVGLDLQQRKLNKLLHKIKIDPKNDVGNE